MFDAPGFWHALWPGAHQVAFELFTPQESWFAKLLRPVIIYGFLLVALRIAGRRELAQLNVFDLVVLLTLSNTVQNAIIGNDNSALGGIIGAVVLLLVNYLVVRFLYRHPRLDALVEGAPVVLIEDGRIKQENLRKQLITTDELLAAVHRQGVERVQHVATAILETSGTITVIPKEPGENEREGDLIRRIDVLAAELRALRELLATEHRPALEPPASHNPQQP